MFKVVFVSVGGPVQLSKPDPMTPSLLVDRRISFLVSIDSNLSSVISGKHAARLEGEPGRDRLRLLPFRTYWSIGVSPFRCR